jgi:hypothetical protein
MLPARQAGGHWFERALRELLAGYDQALAEPLRNWEALRR